MRDDKRIESSKALATDSELERFSLTFTKRSWRTSVIPTICRSKETKTKLQPLQIEQVYDYTPLQLEVYFP